MKVLEASEGPLTNYEVMTLLEERKNSRMERKTQSVLYAERNWVDSKVLKCLTNSPCKTLTEDKIAHFLSMVAGFQLTNAEKLQFINHCPMELVDVHLIIEDCAERLTEVQVEELMAITAETLGATDDDEEVQAV
ncbi:unnamed protein product [Aphanomyces euteiches]|uniref:DNA-directed RNA polymerase III subunit RPC9 n=1 Tax=Aphanomyces euteiches TaxID=100861 RepID=A0A6G0WPL9_9STRA|nr:hypothetical protein Ae201684_013082 [Aphanomyces euteiches]KAG9411270.1 hypothetical protein AC1031_016909 [Aphanomyces cochlioides]KAH9076891.1 hypothetical protein Ae201684P_010822 [Aphanomyces euteiches]KAH9089448.1 hypothetical protein LEN26_019168 [Aphanomyces euteiches]KAH9105902.1 hypothetical protein AeMF1_018406 [Aphanomyces euteiches]